MLSTYGAGGGGSCGSDVHGDIVTELAEHLELLHLHGPQQHLTVLTGEQTPVCPLLLIYQNTVIYVHKDLIGTMKICSL